MGEPVWREEIVAVVRPHERQPTVTVVTPWLNHTEFWPDYAAAMELGRPDEILVIDNGSDPLLGFANIDQDENLGFCRANNVGLAEARSEAVVFLNNDIAATSRKWLQAIREALEPGFLVGARFRYDPHGAIEQEPMTYLDGWCIAGMVEDLDGIGGWDETLAEPAYYSDNILCLRARMAGMRLREVKTGLVHKLNGTAKPQDPETIKATFGNRARYETLAREALAHV